MLSWVMFLVMAFDVHYLMHLITQFNPHSIIPQIEVGAKGSFLQERNFQCKKVKTSRSAAPQPGLELRLWSQSPDPGLQSVLHRENTETLHARLPSVRVVLG